MTSKIIVLFNLKRGVSAADYEAWAKSVDLPTVNGLASVDEFAVLRSTGLLGSDSPAPYAYTEIIDVNDMDRFGAEVDTDKMKAIAASFQKMADAPLFILTEPLK
jgi:hypothetical protein